MFYFLLSSMASRIRLSLLLQVYPGTSHDLYFLPLKAFGKFKCCVSPPDWYYLYRLGLPKAMLCLRISSLDGRSICSVIFCGSWALAENIFNLNEKKIKSQDLRMLQISEYLLHRQLANLISLVCIRKGFNFLSCLDSPQFLSSPPVSHLHLCGKQCRLQSCDLLTLKSFFCPYPNH